MWGLFALVLISIFILAILYNYIFQNKKNNKNNNTARDKSSMLEPFIAVNDNNLYMPIGSDGVDKTPATIKYQIPIAQNQLTDIQLQSLDTDILRNVRVLKNFSTTDELDFYQMYNLIKKFKTETITFTYDPRKITKKTELLESEKLIELNTGAINTTDLDLYFRLKLEIISLLNKLVIQNNYYLPYHQYQFFKIINNNLISRDTIINTTQTSNTSNTDKYIFTLTIAREFKYQQFILYFDIDLISTTNSDNTSNYTLKFNNIELIGIPIPNTIEFHENRKTRDIPDSKAGIDIITLVEKKHKLADDAKNDDLFKDQIRDSATFDVKPIGDGKSLFQSPATKFIDVMERSDMDRSIFDENSQNAFVEQKIMNVARDQQFKNHRCYGLVNGKSKELVEYNDNPIFCRAYHPEINQVGIWDAPCQINSDCPFYQANKNYPNEFGKCDKVSGKCEMPLGVIPIGFTKYGHVEPECYNCNLGSMSSVNSMSNKCCGKQKTDIDTGKVSYKSPDYIFLNDEDMRRQFSNSLQTNGLQVNPSI